MLKNIDKNKKKDSCLVVSAFIHFGNIHIYCYMCVRMNIWTQYTHNQVILAN